MAILLFLLRLIGWVLLTVPLLLLVALLIPLGVRFAYRPGMPGPYRDKTPASGQRRESPLQPQRLTTNFQAVPLS